MSGVSPDRPETGGRGRLCTKNDGAIHLPSVMVVLVQANL